MHQTAQNVFNKTFYEIQYKADLNIIDTLWYGYSSQSDLRKACQIGLELTRKVKCPYKLNDNTHFTGPWDTSVAWLEKEWLPSAMEAGVRYLAHIASPDSFDEAAGEVMQMSLIGKNLFCVHFLLPRGRNSLVKKLPASKRQSIKIKYYKFALFVSGEKPFFYPTFIVSLYYFNFLQPS